MIDPTAEKPLSFGSPPPQFRVEVFLEPVVAQTVSGAKLFLRFGKALAEFLPAGLISTNLIGAVLAIVLVHPGVEQQAILACCDERPPLVVDPAIWNRSGLIDKFPSQHHRLTCDEISAYQSADSLTRDKIAFFPSRNPKTLQNPHSQQLAVLVNQIRIGVDKQQVRVILEMSGEAVEFVWVPHVVLVTESDQVSRTVSQGVGEVRRSAAGIVVHHYGEGDSLPGTRTIEYVVDDGERVVGRLVVRDDNLVGKPGLSEDALELRTEKSLAVIGS